MEDGVKESPAKPKEAPFLGKSGWVKKASGRFLVSYKDRYIQVEKTQVLMYEKEDLQNCLEKVDLGNYDKCQELKSAFKKKNRLVLIRSPKDVNKVSDVKLQASSLQEKEAWIKALSDGIERAKNKVFDEVKTDESSNLDHVTRLRPKGNPKRRPPTRIHMKEVASISSDGILRLDLDVPDSSTPNGILCVDLESTDSSKERVKSLQEEESQEIPQPEEPSSQKKVLKPPMPPSKEAKPTAAAESEEPNNTSSEKKAVLKPPMPPSKESKPAVSADCEVSQEDTTSDDDLEKSPEDTVETEQPATPSDKPLCSSADNLAVSPQSSQNPKPPTPPSKDKKPTQPISTSEITPLELEGVKDEDPGEEQDISETTSPDVNQTITTESLTAVLSSMFSPIEISSLEVEVEPLVTSTNEQTHAPEENNSAQCSEVPTDPENEFKESQLKEATPPTSDAATPEPIKKSPGPPTPFKKKPIKIPPPKTQVETCDLQVKKITSPPDEEPNPPPTMSPPDLAVSKPEEPESDLKLPEVVLCLADPVADSPNSSPASYHRSLEKRECEEEKSVDSGQHSDDDGEVLEAGDTVTCSTAPLRGSQAALDINSVSEDDNEPPDSLGSMEKDPPVTATTQVPARPQVSSAKVHSTFLNVRINQSSHPSIPLKPSARSASLGDLLSESTASDRTSDGVGVSANRLLIPSSQVPHTPDPHVMDRESEVDLKLEEPEDLGATLASQQSPESGQSSAVLGGDGLEESSGDRGLARGMEELRKADILQEKSTKESNHSENNSKRNSW